MFIDKYMNLKAIRKYYNYKSFSMKKIARTFVI